MKLKCTDHQRRVVVLETGTVVHRNGDGSKCTSVELRIGPSPSAGSYVGRSGNTMIGYDRLAASYALELLPHRQSLRPGHAWRQGITR